MAVRWRDLFDHLRVSWTDSRRYAERNGIAIQCPWCGNADPSTHLAINEETGAYRCLRAPGDHSGYSPHWLLQALGTARRDSDDLLEEYGYTGPARRPERAPPVPSGPFARRWDTFRPAHLDGEACDYLMARGFWRPAVTAREFDLRVASGKWAARLWFPITKGDEVIGYTGRAMRGQQPRYWIEAADTCLYMPRPADYQDKLLILVEGPIDALRLADAVLGRYNLLVAALCGTAITESKRLQLLALARMIPQFFVVLDSTVSPVNVNRLIMELRTLPVLGVRRLDPPLTWDGEERMPAFGTAKSSTQSAWTLPAPDIGDPGEMKGEEIELWLQQTGLAQMA